MGMRVLFTTPGGLGHVHPTVPLARAMVERGHDVLWAAPPWATEHVERAGLRSAPVAGIPPAGPAEVMRAYPELEAVPHPARGEVMFGKLFGRMVAPAMLEGLVPIAQEFRPDLVIADQAEFAGHVVAAELGVPSVTKGFGALLSEARVRNAAEDVAPLWRSRGLEPRPYGGSYDRLYLDIYPAGLPQMEASHVGRSQPLRPVTYDGPVDPSVTVPLPDGPADGPLVYLTMGTVFNDVGPLSAAVAALAELDVRLLVTVGPRGEPGALGPQPSNVRVERYVPQSLVLPQCSVVVSHAGSGTSVATLSLGVPQLCLPQGADQFMNADAISAVGAGLALAPPEASADAISAAVKRLLAEDAFRAAAAGVATSIEGMPSPAEVAEVLESVPA
ncbi:MAG TPA: glycosyltransferase [Acidimicrobiales bacterium]|nr:glycosyltransferase [Acidimicrobiales bacterium]